jgi:hypothetical protein
MAVKPETMLASVDMGSAQRRVGATGAGDPASQVPGTERSKMSTAEMATAEPAVHVATAKAAAHMTAAEAAAHVTTATSMTTTAAARISGTDAENQGRARGEHEREPANVQVSHLIPPSFRAARARLARAHSYVR